MMKHYTHDNWAIWLEQLSLPLSENCCGEDLKYEEDFKYLKSSFSGVSELDCKKIFIIGTKLTAEKSKDLRIVSYVLLAAASEYGIEGLTNSLTLLNELIEKFFIALHPLKEKARIGVHIWLLSQQKRIIALAEQTNDVVPQHIALLQEQLNIYGNKTVRQIDGNAGPLSDLTQWADKLSKKHPVIVTKSTSTADVKHLSENRKNEASNNTEQVIKSSSSAPQVVASDTQFSETLRKLIAFDKEKNNVARMLGLSRAARWSDIKLPPNEQGKTRIPAPRNTAFIPITNALSTNDNLTAFMLGEALFMEGAMHFNLDLQVMQLSALKGLGNTSVVKQLELALYQLTSAFPQLTHLTYDDSSNFCSAKTKDVIADITAQYTQASNSVSAENELFDQAENIAKKWVEESKLDSALATLNDLPTKNSYERAQVTLIKAKMCLLSERYDFAEPMLKTLINTIDEHSLGEWQPSFCMQVWRNTVLCFDTLAAKGNEKLAEQSKVLKQKMILTQPEIALGWI